MNVVSVESRGRASFRQHVLPAIPAIASVGVGLTLMVAALLKSADPRDTLAVLEFVFGREASRPLLYALLFVEIALGSALIAVLRPRVTLSLAAALFLVFLAWIGYLHLVDAPITCGCGLPNTHWLLGDGRGAAAVRAGALLIASSIGFFIARRRPPSITKTEGVLS